MSSSSLVEIDAPAAPAAHADAASHPNRPAPTDQFESDHSSMPPPSYDALDPRPLQALVDARANTAVFAAGASSATPVVVAKSVASNSANSAASVASAPVATAEWAKVHANISELSQSMRALEERVVRSNAASEKRLDAFQRQLDDLPDLIATRVESALKAELKRQQALDALNKTTSSSSIAAPTGLPMAAGSVANNTTNNKQPVQYSRLPGASLSEGVSVPDEDDFAPPVAFAQWKPSLQAPGAVEAPVQQQPPLQQQPFQLPQQQQQPVQPQFHQPQPVLQPQQFSPQQQQYNAPQPYPVYQQPPKQQPQQQQQPVYQPAPAPVATYVAQPTLSFPETSNYATYSASGFDTSPSVLYPVSASAPHSSSNRAPEVDQRAKQEADDAALAARLQREMNDEGSSSSSAAASQRSSSMPTTTSYMPAAASPSYSYMTAPPPASMMPPSTSSAAAAAGPSTATRQCPVCQINVASDMLELHVNEHFEALDEPVPQGNYGMPVPTTGADGTVKPAPRRGLMARLFGGPENKPAEVQQGRPPSNGYPGSVVAQPTPQYTNTNVAYARVAQQYYPQSYPSSNPGNN